MRIVALLLFCAAVAPSDAMSAQATCSFVLLGGKALVGASVTPFSKALGPATGGKLNGERAWGTSAAQFLLVGLQAEGVSAVGVTSYGGRIFEAELDYPTTDLPASIQDLERRLSPCAERKTSDCWMDRANNYYIVSGQGNTLALFIGNKRLAGPGGKAAPIRCLKEHRARQ
jgi:hypothetical protein